MMLKLAYLKILINFAIIIKLKNKLFNGLSFLLKILILTVIIKLSLT